MLYIVTENCYNLFMYIISGEFEKFIAEDCNRQEFIISYLKKRGIEAPVISINGKNHIYVKFPLRQYNPIYKIKTVIAHYDRVPESPGANDNSAAVFCMLEWACKLYESSESHNIRLIFTDGEEQGAEGINQQGSYDLAQLFKKLNILNDDIFVFDCMGRGDIPVISQIKFPSDVSPAFVKQYSALEKKAEKLLSQVNNGKWFKVPSDYSDNVSFLVNGIPAVAISMLPSSEIEDAVQGKKVRTWEYLHSPKDNMASLWPQAFEITGNLLILLAKARFIIE